MWMMCIMIRSPNKASNARCLNPKSLGPVPRPSALILDFRRLFVRPNRWKSRAWSRRVQETLRVKQFSVRTQEGSGFSWCLLAWHYGQRVLVLLVGLQVATKRDVKRTNWVFNSSWMKLKRESRRVFLGIKYEGRGLLMCTHTVRKWCTHDVCVMNLGLRAQQSL